MLARSFPCALMLAVGLLYGARAGAADPAAPVTASRSEGPPRGGPLAGLTVKASTETSVYSDDDHVDVVTPTVAGSIEDPIAGWSVGAHYLVDVVTAASADIIATASPPFREVRHAGSLNGAYKRGDLSVGAQVSFSVEPDYLALSAGAQGALDMAQKNFTLLLGYTYGHDTAGRASTPFDVFQKTLERHSVTSGLTAILNRAAIAAVTFDTVVERGDQSKPYRYVPMFAQGMSDDVPPGASVELVSALRLHARPLEALPQSRDRFALTGRLAYRVQGATLRVEERLYIDTWSLKASTTDLRYMFDFGPFVTIWPHLRAHLQSGADFWRRVYEVNRASSGAIDAPEIRTGDRELGPLWAFTGGGGASIKITPRFAVDLQVDGVFTRYLDALYITHRRALFTALSAHAAFD